MSATNARPEKLKVFFDADVLISGAAPRSRQSAPFILLQLSELTLIEGVSSPYVVEQAERNIQAKLPNALEDFIRLREAAVSLAPDPTTEELERFQGLAHPEDLPVLAAAVLSGCRYLVTRNLQHYPKALGGLQVIDPGRLVRNIRRQLAKL
mgnify:FL=1